MHLDYMFNDRETQAKATTGALGADVALLEALKEVRQELWCDTLPGVTGGDLDLMAKALQFYFNVAAVGVNLLALFTKFQITCWSREGSPEIIGT